MGWRELVVVLACGCGRLGFEDEAARCQGDRSACPDGYACVDQRCVAAIDAAPVDGTVAPGDGLPVDGQLGPAGSFTLTSPVSYTCAIGLVDVDVTGFTFTDGNGSLTATSDDPGVPQQPCTMMGSISGGSFDVTCTLPGGCNEVYRLVGAFTGADTWSAMLTATFTGQCLDCTLQSFAIVGTRL